METKLFEDKIALGDEDIFYVETYETDDNYSVQVRAWDAEIIYRKVYPFKSSVDVSLAHQKIYVWVLESLAQLWGKDKDLYKQIVRNILSENEEKEAVKSSLGGAMVSQFLKKP